MSEFMEVSRLVYSGVATGYMGQPPRAQRWRTEVGGVKIDPNHFFENGLLPLVGYWEFISTTKNPNKQKKQGHHLSRLVKLHRLSAFM